jgi:hypothetical protein
MEILKRLKKYPKSGPKMTWNIMLQMCLALCWRKSYFCERRNHPGGISLTWKNYENWIDLASSSSGMGGIASVIEMCFNAYITSACKHTHTPKKTSTHTSIASMRRAKLEKSILYARCCATVSQFQQHWKQKWFRDVGRLNRKLRDLGMILNNLGSTWKEMQPTTKPASTTSLQTVQALEKEWREWLRVAKSK